jgi:Asp-tRNA(Asn)/Glu-tRNA(Gln) amidotransferase A subunit family amidase
MLADPIAKNSTLGTFTQFANVLDLTGLAVPAGTYGEGELSGDGGLGRLPFGITLLGGRQTDAEVLEIGRRFGDAMAGKE